MILRVLRFIVLISALALVRPAAPRAEPIMIHFTAQVVSTGNSFDTDNIFGEGSGTDLAGQIIVGSVTIDPASLKLLPSSPGAWYGDSAAGALSVSFTLNGVTSTVTTGTSGFLGPSAGSIQIEDPSHGGSNYLGISATDPNSMVQESIGALFNNATLFDAFGNGDPAAAIASLNHIGIGHGLTAGGITYLSQTEHIDATILSIEVPEPASWSLFGAALLLLAGVRRAATH